MSLVAVIFGWGGKTENFALNVLFLTIIWYISFVVEVMVIGKWLVFFYITATIAAAQLLYQLMMEGTIDWFYLAILITQLTGIYSEKKEQMKQKSH